MFNTFLKRWHLVAGGVLLVAGTGLLVAGCIAQLALTDIAYITHSGVTPVLSMGRHVLKWECECTSCHPGTMRGGESAGMPDRESCLKCHEGLADVGDFALGGLYFREDGSPNWTVVTALPDGVTFSHAKHTEAFDCSECHGAVRSNDYSNVDLAARFANCRRCHLYEELTGDCAHCHSVFDESRRPHSHDAGWPPRHGRYVRDIGGFDRAGSMCRSCHRPSYCLDCHREEKPRDHSVFWAKAGHGLVAGIDRDRCIVCHVEDECHRCHLDRAPPMLPDADHYPPVLSGCTAFPDCHWREEIGHTVLTRNCLLCHK